jgi:hypothetical protein
VTFFTPRFSRHRNCTVAVAWRPSRPEEKIIEPQDFRARALGVLRQRVFSLHDFDSKQPVEIKTIV